MEFCAKVHRSENETVVAICDSHLLNKTFEQCNLVLSVPEEFYGNEVVSHEEAKKMLTKATILNLVGNNIVSLAVSEKIINPENVIKVKGISHAQMVLL